MTPAPRPWLVVQHVAHEGPGMIGSVLDATAVPWTCCRLDQGDELPGVVAGLGGLVVMGGPMGVHDDSVFTWLEGERALLRAAVAAELAVLGVCLGAQQLALALGGEVFPGPNEEIGPGQVNLTEAGTSDPVLGPAGSPLPCVHWHADTFTLPEGARRLAHSDRYEHQAFAVGARAYGLQFHVEVDDTLARGWVQELPPGVHLGHDHLQRVQAVGRPLLERLVALSTRDPVTAPP